MNSKRPLSLFPLFTLAGLMACSLNSTTQGGNTGGTTTAGGTQGPGGGTTAVGGSIATGGVSAPGGTPDTGGVSAPGGTTTTGGAPGGTPDTGGVSAPGGTPDTGGVSAPGGTTTTGGVSAPGGTTVTGGTSKTGGTTVAGGTKTGGAMATGGVTTSSSTATAGGSTSTGGAVGGTSSGGKTASGGTAGSTGGTTGAAGAAGAAGAPPPSTGIPAGYPAPTADNYAKCQKVAIGTNDACGGQPSGNICIECLFGGTDYNSTEAPPPTAEATSEAGNYVVTVQLGGAAAGDTYVSAESTRGMLKSVTTTAGQSLEYAFVVNVRAMEGQPNHAGGPGGYPGLDLFFSGKNPQVTAIGYALATTATKPIMVYVAGDSTTCDQSGGAYGGWAQMLPEYFGPPVGIANYANSGAASGDFGFWGDISSRWTTGDWIIIQFGHNDKTDSDATVEANLTPHVTAALAAGVHPLMVSPPARLQGIPIPDQSSLHAAALKAVATANNVPFIDLTALSTAFYNASGMTQKEALTAYHADGTDVTHTSLPGAEMLAGLVAKAIKDQNIGLAPYLR
jgi:lysophospholipase L1-like esterase